MAGEQQLTLSFDREEGEPMGLMTDDKLTVTRVQEGTIAEGKIQLGDVLQRVNGYPIRDKTHFFLLLNRCYPTQLTISRMTIRPRHGVPLALERLFHRKPGYEYPMVEVDCSQYPGKLFGLILATKYHKVYVADTKAEMKSVSSIFFKVSDKILIVNGTPVSDKEVAKKLIVGSRGRFQAVIERPVSDAAKREVRLLEESYKQEVHRQQQKSTKLAYPPDVVIIAQKQRERMKNPLPELPKILKRTPAVRDPRKRVKLNQSYVEISIPRDVSTKKKLRPVPRS